jgi:exodeoxyribonuclease-1
VVIRNLKVLDEAAQERCGLDLALNLRHAAVLSERLLSIDLTAVWSQVFQREFELSDVDEALYNGFLAGNDRNLLNQLLKLSPQDLAQAQPNFTDARLAELLFRYRARNYPETLSEQEYEAWQLHCSERLHGDGAAGKNGALNFEAFFAELDELEQTGSANVEMLESLRDYAYMIAPES